MPLIFWIGMIAYNSSGAASMNETSRFIRPILEFLFPAASLETIVIYHGYIRKAAHFIEYAVLAMLVWRALRPAIIKTLKLAAISMAAVITIACLDEFNQSFEPSRTSAIGDVLIDTFGGLCTIAAILILQKARPKN